MVVVIRKAAKEDCGGIVALIKELAVFEKMPDGPKLSVRDLVRDGFGAGTPLFNGIVADLDGGIIGMALFYFTYSTWTGKCLYLEDIMVTQRYRNQKIGSRIFQAVAQVAFDENCARLDFSVLSWNPAKSFYERKGAVNITKSENWEKYRIEKNDIEEIARGKK